MDKVEQDKFISCHVRNFSKDLLSKDWSPEVICVLSFNCGLDGNSAGLSVYSSVEFLAVQPGFCISPICMWTELIAWAQTDWKLNAKTIRKSSRRRRLKRVRLLARKYSG